MDEIFDFVRSVFGPDLLVVAPAELVAPLRASDRSKQFLLTVGMPRRIDFAGGTLVFNRLDSLPTLRELFPDYASRIDPGWDDCRFLSLDDDGTGYVLNQADGGSVWRVLTNSTTSEFVNSSVELFGWFLASYTQVATAPRPGTKEGLLELISKMGQRMATMDPRAMMHDSPFWPVVIEDAELYAS